MAGFVPQIGVAGLWGLAAPFNSLLTPKVSYTCRSVRSLSDISAAGETIFDRYYEPIGAPSSLYEADVLANVCIVGLQAGTGEWVYIPSSQITSLPQSEGVLYTSIVLGVQLGPVPDHYALDGLSSKIENVVQSVLGITPVIKGVQTSQPVILTPAEHAKLETARAALISDTTSDYARVQELQKQVIQQAAQIKVLETYIKSHQ